MLVFFVVSAAVMYLITLTSRAMVKDILSDAVKNRMSIKRKKTLILLLRINRVFLYLGIALMLWLCRNNITRILIFCETAYYIYSLFYYNLFIGDIDIVKNLADFNLNENVTEKDIIKDERYFRILSYNLIFICIFVFLSSTMFIAKLFVDAIMQMH